MRLFGTDGIRAPFGHHPLDQETVTSLGFRLAEMVQPRAKDPFVILAGDTRDSTPEICRWLAAGLGTGGVPSRYGGVLPTPAVSMLVRTSGAAAGIAVSASHNLHPDNGIKLFDRDGFKWDPEAERRLEERLSVPLCSTIDVDHHLELESGLAGIYRQSLEQLVGFDRPLSGLRLVVDAAHGAASEVAAPVLGRLGAEVISLGDRPDGRNINHQVGSTAPGAMAEAVVQNRADLGFAFDGDADRVILCDEEGRIRDGDAMLFVWARELLAQRRLEPPCIVATSMSNLGLERALQTQGISVIRCDVGDREVVATMRSHGARLGGEQSGHLVHLDLTTTGDGLVTALQMASLRRRAARPFSQLLAGFRRFPQILRNVRVARKPDLYSLPAVASAIEEVESRLGSEGRLVLRYSGTEPLARVMIEGPDADRIEALAALLTDAIRNELGMA